jgi:hypothetical protein
LTLLLYNSRQNYQRNTFSLVKATKGNMMKERSTVMKMKRTDTHTCRYFLVSFLTALFLFVAIGTVYAAPKNVATAKPGNCGACHGKEKVLPQGHEDTKSMTYEGCKTCHSKPEKTNLQGKMPGSHLHRLQGITCEKCHGKAKKPAAAKMKQCLACHNADKMAEKTAKVKPENPHTSPHYGTTLDCTLCHHQHTKSENYCSQCHKFDFVVP